MVLKNLSFANASKSSIKGDIDGRTMIVPVSTGNRHYNEIIKQEAVIADYQAPVLTGSQQAMQLISDLESEITPRRLREAVISEDGKAWLEAKDAEIAIERAKL